MLTFNENRRFVGWVGSVQSFPAGIRVLEQGLMSWLLAREAFAGSPWAGAALDEAQSGQVSNLPADVEDLTIEEGPNGQVSIRILKLRNAPPMLPVIVYLHGVGWVLGNKHTHDRLIRELALGAGAALVFPDYSLSPEAKYTTAIEENYAVLKWVARRGVEHGMDSERLAVAGDNVGGNLAAALTLMSNERGGPDIRLQLLFYPVMDASFDTESYHQFAEGYHLRRDVMMWFWDQYTANPGERTYRVSD